jgi:hypothetical protein
MVELITTTAMIAKMPANPRRCVGIMASAITKQHFSY